MSFILDALKKSENDRQRQSGPALFEVRVPPPKSRFPLLAVAIVSLLVVNLGVVGWLMLRKPAEAAVPAAAQPQAPAGNPPAAGNVPANGFPPPAAQPNAQYAGQPGVQLPPQGSAAPGYVPGYNGAPPQGYGPNGAPANGFNGGNYNGAQGNVPNNGYGPPPQGAFGQPNPNGYPQQQPGNYQQPNTGAFPPGGALQDPILAEDGEPSLNPDDYAPAREPAPPGSGAGRVVRSTATGLPTYAEAATRTQIPELHMDLHSYAPDPAKRFVLINMKRLYEGQSLPDGVKVESITNDAAIMSYNGTRFVLDSE
jgi:general secretion pathway protein B